MTEATIKIKSRDINSPIPLPGEPQHLFIIHTDSNGKEKTIIRGGTKTNDKTAMLKDNLHIIKAPYEKKFEHLFPGDLVDKAPSQTIFTGTDAQVQAHMDKMWNIAQKVNAANLDYKLPIPYCPPELCHVQNTNTVKGETNK